MLTLGGSSTICCCWCRIWLLVLLLWVSRVLSSSICRGIIRRRSILSSCSLVGWSRVGTSSCAGSRVWVSRLGRHCLLHLGIDRLPLELVNGSVNGGEHLRRQGPVCVYIAQGLLISSLCCQKSGYSFTARQGRLCCLEQGASVWQYIAAHDINPQQSRSLKDGLTEHVN